MYLERNQRLKSYKRQGIDQIPTGHMGAVASAMEKKGIETDIGNLNREIRQANSLMQSIRSMIRKLADWIGAVHEAWREIQAEEAAKPKPVYLGDLLQAKLEIRRAGRSGWSHRAQTNSSIKDIRYFVKELLPELSPDENTQTTEKRSIRERLDENRRVIQESEAQRGCTKTEKSKGKEQKI